MNQAGIQFGIVGTQPDTCKEACGAVHGAAKLNFQLRVEIMRQRQVAIEPQRFFEGSSRQCQILLRVHVV